MEKEVIFVVEFRGVGVVKEVETCSGKGFELGFIGLEYDLDGQREG